MLELLIVMSIIIILIALLAPTLRPVRVKADLTKELSTHHQLLAALNLYAGDSKQYFPYFATPGDPSGPIRVRDFDLAQQDKPYFLAQAGYWPSIVVPRYLSSKVGLMLDKLAGREPFHTPWPDYIIPTDYFLSHTVHAAPGYWVGDEPPENLGLLRGTTWDQVRYPSNKTILLQMIAADGPKGGPDPKINYIDTTVGLADGSAKVVFYPPENFEKNIVTRPFGAKSLPSLSTRNGLDGRDY